MPMEPQYQVRSDSEREKSRGEQKISLWDNGRNVLFCCELFRDFLKLAPASDKMCWGLGLDHDLLVDRN
jgi:hypothetical protein